MRVVSFFNHAGGAGKTSAARDIGYVVAEEGYRVLLIDTDPQANLTDWLGAGEDVREEETLLAVVDKGVLSEPREAHGMALVPASLEIAALERRLVGDPIGFTRLKRAIGALREDGAYDFVFIDCPPSLGQLAGSAVIASDRVVVPAQTSVKAFKAVKTVGGMVEDYREITPTLRVGMYLLTHYDRRTLHDREAAETLVESLSPLAPVAGPLSERPAVYKDASLRGLPVPLYRPGGAADQEVRAAAGTLLQALGAPAHAS